MARKKTESTTFRISDEEYEKLVAGSIRHGLSKDAAAFHSLLGLCLGLEPKPPTDEQMPFLTEFSAVLREVGKQEGWDLRDNITIEPAADGKDSGT